MDKPIIEVKDIDKSFEIIQGGVDNIKGFFVNPLAALSGSKEKFDVLSDISFSIDKSESVGIIGRNGSGKSTLLKILAGIYHPDKGEVKVRGRLVPFLELGVGFNPELSARENIFLNGTILGMTRSFLESKIDEIIGFAELENFVDTPVKNFSSGMLVRLAFAISIQSEADIYLLDEILAVGDAAFQEKSLTIINRLRKEGKTIILVSHDTDSLIKYCTRVIYIKESRLVADGKPRDVINRYLADTFNKKSEKEKNNSSENGEKKILRWGTGEVRVKELKLLGDDNKPKDVFNSKDNITIEVDLERNSDVDKVNVGIGIYDLQTNYYITGINTQIDNYEIKSDKVKLVFDNPSLLRGAYYINVVIFGDDEKKYFDYINNYSTFHIISKEQYRGGINLEHKWQS